MVSKVEAELVKALKLKKQKSSEGRDDYLARALKAIDDLDDDGWAELSEAAQKWANDAAKKAKAKKDIPDFPKDKEDEEEEGEEEEEEKPAKKKSKKDDDEEEETEEEEDGEEEEEEEKPAKKKGKEKAKEDKKPAKEEKKPAKKKAKDDDEEEEEEKEEEETEDDDEDEAPKKKGKKDEKSAKSDKKAAKPEAKAGKRSGAQGVTASIKKIMLGDPQISVENLTDALKEKGFDTISNMTVTTVRADFRHTLRIMKEEGGLSKALSSKMDDE